ncbi:hypothetical protein [Vibrio sinaloensis]|uniref:hypothetical protein n=1 Tax=Photobacterium sp. (strain ATCC 43367) TaxID=379097 RepID=UPI0005800775|nr:hypothetical protein [Vibrio sinaloensis]KHT47852.1 hypothetical protein RJ47_03255 [Vibrio sinaloensis]
MTRKNIMAIASSGGHNVQLTRLTSKLTISEGELIHIRTRLNSSDKAAKFNEFLIDDMSRDNPSKCIKISFQLIKLILEHKPKLIITTGALPGLIGIILGRVFFVRTIWLDSIANTQKLSLSGRIAQYFAHEILTQWPNLSNNNVKYYGNVL